MTVVVVIAGAGCGIGAASAGLAALMALLSAELHLAACKAA
jgi:hypothetical protein